MAYYCSPRAHWFGPPVEPSPFQPPGWYPAPALPQPCDAPVDPLLVPPEALQPVVRLADDQIERIARRAAELVLEALDAREGKP